MKTLSRIPALFFIGVLVFSCQKEIQTGPVINQQSTGSLAEDNAGNCAPVTVNGIYKVNRPMDGTNYIDVSVNVSSSGSYVIGTDTVNGIYFRDSASFTATGLQTVRLKAWGMPLTAGAVSLTVHYNNSSSCAVPITVSASGNTTASFTLAGAPGSCTAPVIQGTYIAGIALTPANKLVLGVNVISPGDYTLSTSTANGFSFTATGTFTATGIQTVVLSGTGTPAAAGATVMSVTGAPAGCSFTITVNSGTSTGNQFIAAYILDTSLAAPFDTVGRYLVTYDAQNRPVVINETSFKPNGDSLFHGITTLTYAGADTFAQQKVYYTKDFSATPASVSTKIFYYVFSGNRMTRDSALYTGYSNYQVADFTYAGNTVTRNERRYGPGAPALLLINSTAYQTFVSGNNTYQIDTAVSHYANNNNPATYNYTKTEITTSYVPNPNPFYQVYKASREPMFYEEMGISSRSAPPCLMSQQIEHAVSWGPGSSGNNLNQIDYIYNFRPDGYPSIAWYTFNNIGIISKGKILFYYR